MSNLPFSHYLAIGDWSNDGHGRVEDVHFRCSHNAQDIKEAYKRAIKTIGLCLHTNNHDNGIREVLTNYADCYLTYGNMQTFEKHGIDIDWNDIGDLEKINEVDSLLCNPKSVAILFMEMVKTQLPAFEYEYIIKNKPLNGYWSKDFNFTIGYGVFG